MSKTRKSLLRSSLVMLIVATFALTSATYAWFTEGNKGELQSIEFTAKAANGIQISVDAVNWKSNVTASELKTAQSGALVGTMIPLSTTASVDSSTEGSKGTITLYSGKFENDGSLTTSAAAMATADADGYFKYDLYFKNEGAKTQKLYLDLSSEVKGVTSSAVESTESTAAIPAKEDKGIQNAVRLAFIDEAQGTLVNSAQTVSNILKADAGTSAVVWEPNATTHTSYATTYRYATDANGNPTNNLATASGGKYSYVGIAAGTSSLHTDKGVATADTTETANANKNGDNTALVSTVHYVSSTSTKVQIASLPANQVTKVTIYMWIEGQDIDCNNYESGGTVSTTLKFLSEEDSSST